MLRGFISAPYFADEDKRRQARIFHRVCWAVFATRTVFLGSSLFAQQGMQGQVAQSLSLTFVLCLGMLELNRRGWTRTAGVLLIAGFIGRSSYVAFLTGGLHSPGVAYFLVYVLIADLVLGARAGIATAVVCAAITFALAHGEMIGFLQPRLRFNAYMYWLLQTMYTGFALIVGRLASESIREALGRAGSELAERRRAESRLSLALDAGGIAVWELDVARGIFRGDARAFDLLGLPVPDDRGISFKDWTARVHPEDFAGVSAALDSVVKGEKLKSSAEYRIIRPDGAVRHMEGAAEAASAESGAPAFVVGMVRDVTERRRLFLSNAERIKELTALTAASSVLRDESLDVPGVLAGLVALLPAAFQYPDITRARVAFGDAAAETPGFRETEWKLKQPFVVEGGGDGFIEVVYLEPRDADAVGPFFLEEKQLLETLARMLRVALEGRIAQAARAASEARYRGIVETSEEGILMADAAGRITFANPKLCALAGWKESELVGQQVRVLLFPEDEAATAARRDERMKTGETQQFDLRIKRRDGASVPVFVSASVVRGPGGEPAGTLAMMTDMSSRDRLQAELHQTQKIDAMGRLSGGVAHDFNNLLTAILGFAELVHMTMPPEDERKEDVAQIIATSHRAASLTRQLLAFSRKQALTPVVLDLRGVAREMEKMLARLIGEHIKVVVKPGDEPLHCLVDRGQMEQVLLNLSVNARDAMPKGGTLTISLGRALLPAAAAEPLGVPAGEYAALAVADTGSGMTEETRRRLFEPFFTTKPKGEGTGLGLSTVHGIVKQSGGCLRVRSVLGGGSTFEVLLPLTDKPLGERSAPAGGSARGFGTLVLVDDDKPIRQVAARVLSAAGFRVLEADDGRGALELLAKEPSVRLLITDVVMPGMGGFELVEKARAAHPELRVLCISGYLDREAPAGGLAYLQKPFSSKDLTEKVRAVLA